LAHAHICAVLKLFLPATASAILEARPAGRDLPINSRIDGSIVTFFNKSPRLTRRCSQPKSSSPDLCLLSVQSLPEGLQGFHWGKQGFSSCPTCSVSVASNLGYAKTLLLSLFNGTADGFLPGGSGTIIRLNTQKYTYHTMLKQHTRLHKQ
jgi:hypothetical protein